MSVSMLGRFEVQVEGRTVIDRAWPRRKAQTLLKVLALRDGHALHREQMLECLWPDMEPQAAGNNLRQALHFLRNRPAECGVTCELVTVTGGVLALSTGAVVDVDSFSSLASQAIDAGDAEHAEQALALYAGDLLPDDLYEEWTVARRDELKEFRDRLLFRLSDIYEANGQVDLAIARLRELLRADPALEQAHQRLMRIYVQTSRREQALRQYTRLRDALQKELGVEPSPETEAIYRGILERDAAPGAAPARESPVAAFPAALRTAARGQFVGRAPELAQLQDEWTHARAGECRLVFVAGQAGIGKTRLSAEFASAVHAQGATVLFGRCDEEPLDPYQPITHALRTYLGVPKAGPEAEALLKSRPALARLIPGAAADAPTAARSGSVIDDGGSERLRFFDDVSSLLQEIAAQPTVLILDDLHWADKPAVLLLKHLIQAPGDASLLIIGSYRDDEVTPAHPLSPLLADLRRERAYHSIELQGLDRAAIATFMSTRGVAGAPPSFVDAISKRTDGNPFFLEETLSHLSESGAFSTTDRWSLLETTIPQGVKDVVGRRLMRLSPNCDRALQVASVAGAEFAFDVIESVSGMAKEPLLDALDEALQAHVIAEVPDAHDRYHFSHDLIRSVLYGELSSGRRARLHELVGQALENAITTKPEAPYAELAYHFSVAGADPERAVRYSKLAGDQALRLLAYEEAVHHYRRALEQRGSTGQQLICETLIALGDAQACAGEKAMGQAAFEQAAVIARELDAGALLAQAALGRAGTWVGAGYGDPAAIALLEEAASKTSAADGALYVRVLSRLAVELYYTDDPMRRESLSREAVGDARALDNPRELAYALNARYYAVWGRGSVDERLEIASEMLTLAEKAGDKELILQGHHFRAFGFLELGEIGAVRSEVQTYQRLADELRQPIYLYRSAARRGMLALLEGRFADVEKSVGEMHTISRSIGDENAAIEIGVQTLIIRRDRGTLAELKPLVQTFLDTYPALSGWRAVLAFTCSESGAFDEAREILAQFAATDYQDLQDNANWLISHCLLADVCSTLGDAHYAPRLYDVILPYGPYNVVAGAGSAFHGAVTHYLAILATLMSRWDDAAQHFEAALAMHTQLGARPWVARTQHAYGSMLKASGRGGERANELCSEAAETARALGMKVFEAEPVGSS